MLDEGIEVNIESVLKDIRAYAVTKLFSFLEWAAHSMSLDALHGSIQCKPTQFIVIVDFRGL